MGRWVKCSVVVAASILAAACSSASSPGGATKRSISDFRAAADVVCARANSETAAWRSEYQRRFGAQAPNAEQAKQFLVEVVLPQADSAVGDLRDTGEPTLDRSTWDAIMRDVDSQLSRLHSTAESDPVGTAQKVVAPNAGLLTPLKARFDAFGTKECGKPS